MFNRRRILISSSNDKVDDVLNNNSNKKNNIEDDFDFEGDEIITINNIFKQFLLKQFVSSPHNHKLPFAVSVSGLSKLKHYDSSFKRWSLPTLYDLSANLIDLNRTCGEDAFSISSNKNNFIAAVADGVGGWSKLNIDAGIVSHKLCAYINDIASTVNEMNNMNALDILKAAYNKLMIEGKNNDELVGSTTICVMKIEEVDNQFKLDYVNVGDCGLFVIRNGKIIHEAKTSVYQQHHYRVPYQITVLSPYMKMQSGAVESYPNDGALGSCELEANDKIILASDGILDNVYAPDLVYAENPQDLIKKAVQANMKVDDMTAMIIKIPY